MAAASKNCGALLRILGVVFGVAAVVGGMVGQGILRTPGIVAGGVHSAGLALAMWAFGAVVVAISAFAYVELGTAIPCAGGPYDFVRRAFGPRIGVLAGWAGFLILASAQAFLATVVAEFLQRLGVLTILPTQVLSVAVLALFWGVNWTSTRISGDSQILFSAAKGAALIALVILFFAKPAAAGSAAPPLTGAIGIAGLAVAMRGVINAYAGWEDTVYHCEELERPERCLPRSMAVGIASVAALYLLVNVALLHVLTPAQMAASNFPAADAIRLILGPRGETLLTWFGVLSVAAITNLNVMRGARVSFAMARGGDLPASLSRVASSGIPRHALAASVAFAALIAATGTYDTIVAMNIPLTVGQVMLVNLSAMRLRKVDPHLARPFRIPLYPLPPLLAVAINAVLLAALVFEDPLHSLEGFAFLAVIGAIYAMIGSRRQAAILPAG